MSGVNQPVQPTAPGQVGAPAPSGEQAAVEAYRRAVQAKPTGFTENPLGAMANAMDRIGRAAGSMLQKGQPVPGQDGLGPFEQRLLKANAAAKANPNSLAARQEQLVAAATLLNAMKHLPANDARRVQVSGFMVQLANQLGAQGIPFNVPGIDMRGLLRLAAQVTSRFGDAAGMQNAFSLEQLLMKSLTGSSVEALRLRDQLFARFNISKQAANAIANGWTVTLASPGQMPKADVSTRTLSLSATQENPNLGVLARAYWHDSTLSNPADKDGFMQAFLKIANQGGFSMLGRKYREVRRMARHELASSRNMAAIGSTQGAPVVAVNQRAARDDESGDMFAALASFVKSEEGAQSALPEALAPPLQRFFAA